MMDPRTRKGTSVMHKMISCTISALGHVDSHCTFAPQAFQTYVLCRSFAPPAGKALGLESAGWEPLVSNVLLAIPYQSPLRVLPG